MPGPNYQSALIVGAGRGLSASLARLFAREGMRVALAARDTEKLAPLCSETGARAFTCDAVVPAQVARLFAAVEDAIGAPEVVVYNASARARGISSASGTTALARPFALLTYFFPCPNGRS